MCVTKENKRFTPPPPPLLQLEPLRQWTASGKPVWGTCAGMIMVADRAEGQKAGGQALIGGLDILVSRNYFGAQSASFEAPVEIALLETTTTGVNGADESSSSLSLLTAAPPDLPIGVFIRAPAILSCGVGVVPLAFVNDPRISSSSSSSESETATEKSQRRVCVAAASRAIVVTAFHPELSRGTAWHAFFARLVEVRTGVQLLPLAHSSALSTSAATGSDHLPYDVSSPLPSSFNVESATSGNSEVYGIARRIVPGEVPWGSKERL